MGEAAAEGERTRDIFVEALAAEHVERSGYTLQVAFFGGRSWCATSRPQVGRSDCGFCVDISFLCQVQGTWRSGSSEENSLGCTWGFCCDDDGMEGSRELRHRPPERHV